jgi:MYXO-CTERM domain-containing protein
VTEGALVAGLGDPCGTVSGGITTSVEVTVDQDKETLVVVASFDAHGNDGVASNAACATPEEVDDFFEWYRELGGEAGGGYCNCSLVGARRGTSQALFAVLSVLALAFGRRRRRKR